MQQTTIECDQDAKIPQRSLLPVQIPTNAKTPFLPVLHPIACSLPVQIPTNAKTPFLPVLHPIACSLPVQIPTNAKTPFLRKRHFYL